MRKVTTAALAAAAIALGALVGCGQSDEDQIRDAVGRLGFAFAESDGKAACRLMTGEAKRQLAAAGALVGAFGCEGAVAAGTSVLDDSERRELRDLRITSVAITGDTATAMTDVVVGEGPVGPTRLRKIDGHWLIDAEPQDGYCGDDPLGCSQWDARADLRWSAVMHRDI